MHEGLRVYKRSENSVIPLRKTFDCSISKNQANNVSFSSDFVFVLGSWTIFYNILSKDYVSSFFLFVLSLTGRQLILVGLLESILAT